MSSKNKKSENANEPKPTTTVSLTVGNYEKHPFFVKKAATSKALLSEVGLPKQLTSKVRR